MISRQHCCLVDKPVEAEGRFLKIVDLVMLKGYNIAFESTDFNKHQLNYSTINPNIICGT